jgi:Fe-S cluster biogenesis protein NfuA
MTQANVSEPGLRMHAERTPNPNSLKWVLGESIAAAGTAASFESGSSQEVSREVSPLAYALFSVAGVTEVFVARDFVTVSKNESVEWLDIAQSVVEAIKSHLESGEPALGPEYELPETVDRTGDELVAHICRVIDEQIRPAVARDGGDVVFVRYQDGVVELQMKGACSGCPSATLTLKNAIETRLKGAIPQIQDVVAV